MKTTAIDPTTLRGAALFWYVMDRIKEDGRYSVLDDEPTGPYTRWDQSRWRRFVGHNRCGTTLCLAGYVCEVTGGKWLIRHNSDTSHLICSSEPYPGSILYDLLEPEPDDHPDDIETALGYTGVRASRRALRLLGLEPNDPDIGHYLFASGNSYEALVRYGVELFGPSPSA